MVLDLTLLGGIAAIATLTPLFLWVFPNVFECKIFKFIISTIPFKNLESTNNNHDRAKAWFTFCLIVVYAIIYFLFSYSTQITWVLNEVQRYLFADTISLLIIALIVHSILILFIPKNVSNG